MRILLPKDAIIEKKDWMNITKTDNFQQVDYYQTTRLLELTNFDINYKIVNTKCEQYSYKLYKQSWIRKYDIEIKKWNDIIKKVWLSSDYDYRSSVNSK